MVRKRDERKRLEFWLDQQLQNLENLRAIGASPDAWAHGRSEIFRDMQRLARSGNERSAFDRLQWIDQQALKREFPHLFGE